MDQMNLIEPISASRKAARRQAVEHARARGERMATLAADKADYLHAEWCEQATQKLRELAKRCAPGIFSIETARLAINFPVPVGGDLRAWGKVTTAALEAGYIERVPQQFTRAASSHGSLKSMYRAGRNA